ncbi:MAG: rhamnulokinase [Gemmataceae bacterium]|nr:rhamnulokinase [Gemmataceae bacterium]
MAAAKFLAFDLGAESGRGILGLFDGARLALEEIHRFPNGGVRTLDSLHWDVLRLWSSIGEGLRHAAARAGGVDSVGIDTWGVDFALLGRDGSLLGNPRHYRDPHTEAYPGKAFATVPREEVFRQTGIQFMRFNSLYQLLALRDARSPLLDAARHLLFIPDLFHYWLTGIKANELTDASTSQMIDPSTRGWAYPLAQSFGLDTRLLGSIVQPGTVLGPLRAGVASDAGLNPVPVVATATHDTAAAVAAVPAGAGSWAYISSGTWSLMGVELDAPLLGEAALRANFTNEIGFGGTVRFLKNVMGLWLVQECRRAWERAGQRMGYDELMRLASEAAAFGPVVDPDDASFILPASMPQALADYCRKSGQAVPQGVGPVVRCALESLALRYRWVLARLEELTGTRRDTIHIVGGGCQNELLCQLTADACGRVVVAGPVEATAIGNVLVQAVGLRHLGSLADGREVVRASFGVKRYEPRPDARWEERYGRFLGLLD